MTVRNAILLLGVFGIFFAFACPLAPTPILVCKIFLLALFVFVLVLMTRKGIVIATLCPDVPTPCADVACSPPQVSARILLC